MRHNIQTALTYAPSLKAWAVAVHKASGSHCTISGAHRSELPPTTAGILDPAHIFPRSTFPELRLVVENGLSIVRFRHCWPFTQHPKGCLDKVFDSEHKLGRDRNMPERFVWLVENLHERFEDQGFEQLYTLVTEGAKISQKVLSRRDHLLRILARAAA